MACRLKRTSSQTIKCKDAICPCAELKFAFKHCCRVVVQAGGTSGGQNDIKNRSPALACRKQNHGNEKCALVTSRGVHFELLIGQTVAKIPSQAQGATASETNHYFRAQCTTLLLLVKLHQYTLNCLS